MIEIIQKTCKNCGIKKSSDLFNKRLDVKDGLYSNCKACVLLKTKEYYKTPKGKQSKQKYQKEYIQRPEVKIHEKQRQKEWAKTAIGKKSRKQSHKKQLLKKRYGLTLEEYNKK